MDRREEESLPIQKVQVTERQASSQLPLERDQEGVRVLDQVQAQQDLAADPESAHDESFLSEEQML